jgi:hypothetical protein
MDAELKHLISLIVHALADLTEEVSAIRTDMLQGQTAGSIKSAQERVDEVRKELSAIYEQLRKV